MFNWHVRYLHDCGAWPDKTYTIIVQAAYSDEAIRKADAIVAKSNHSAAYISVSPEYQRNHETLYQGEIHS